MAEISGCVLRNSKRWRKLISAELRQKIVLLQSPLNPSLDGGAKESRLEAWEGQFNSCVVEIKVLRHNYCLLYTSPSPRDS